MRRIRFIALFALLLSSRACLAQDLKVHVVNISTGKPMVNVPVSLNLLYGKENVPPTNYGRTMIANTDANGDAHFPLPAPPPAHLSVLLQLSWHWHCVCGVFATTSEVFQRGVVAGHSAPNSQSRNPALTPSPGTILVTAWPLSFFERLLYPLLKG
jgi:hypothetical protein